MAVRYLPPDDAANLLPKKSQPSDTLLLIAATVMIHDGADPHVCSYRKLLQPPVTELGSDTCRFTRRGPHRNIATRNGPTWVDCRPAGFG